MKRKFRKIALILCVVTLIASLALVGCSSKKSNSSKAAYYLSLESESWKVYDSESSIPERVHFKKSGSAYSLEISLDAGEQFTINKVGSTGKIGYDWLFSSAGKLVSGDNGAFKVAEKGKFTISLDVSSSTVSYTYSADVQSVTVESVTLDKTELVMEMGEKVTLNASVQPANGTHQNFFWDTKDDSIVTVENGVVTAVGYGTTTVTVMSAPSGVSTECTVTVRQPVTSVAFKLSDVKSVVGGNARTLNIEFAPQDATYKTYTYEVTAGQQYIELKDVSGELTVKGLAAGTATIVVTSVDNPNATATCTVTVLPQGSVVAQLDENQKVTIDEQVTLQLAYDGPDYDSIEWAVGSSTVATVVGDGLTAVVTGKNFGTTTVTANVTVDGETYTATSRILVSEEWFFIYGVGLSDVAWTDWNVYVSDKAAAARDERLMTEKFRGVYTLTRNLLPTQSFQIIFPNVASYVDGGGNWNKDIKDTYKYFDTANSDVQYVSNLADQFKVNTAGVYTITLDLTGSQAKVSIKAVSIDVTSVELEVVSGSKIVLKEGNISFITAKVNPTTATYDDEDVKLWFTSDYADYAKYVDCYFDGMNITIDAWKDIPQRSVITVHVKVFELEKTLNIIVLPSSEQEVSVTSIAFDSAAYFINVNNGGSGWTTTVKANVNADATGKDVRYSTTDSGITVNPTTGVVTGLALGTFTVRATSLVNTGVYADVNVTVYSDTFYLSGVVNDELRWGDPSPYGQSSTSLGGSVLSHYAFTDTGDHKTFTLSTPLKAKDLFQIVFLGMDVNWTNVVTAAYLDIDNCILVENSDEEDSATEENISVTRTAIYKIVLDLSGAEPTLTVRFWENLATSLDIVPQEGEQTTLHVGDTITFDVNYAPKMYDLTAEDFKWSVDEGYADYVDIDFYIYREVLVGTVTVLKAPASGCVQFNINCALDYVTAALPIAIMADSVQNVKPTSIAFEKKNYTYNVNNGGLAWEIYVKALVDANATNNGVMYVIEGGSANFTVDKNTGLVRAVKLGTVTITAMAVADNAVKDTCKVTFYSDTFYLIGEFNEIGTYTSLAPSVTSIGGSIFQDYAFEKVSETYFKLRVNLEKYKKIIDGTTGRSRDEYGFQIAFLGLDYSWNGIITSSSQTNNANTSTYLANQSGNWRVNVAGEYLLEIDLSAASPRVTVNYPDADVSRVVISGKTTIKNGETVRFNLTCYPDSSGITEGMFSFKMQQSSHEDYVTYELDYDNMQLIVTNVSETEKAITSYIVCYLNGGSFLTFRITLVPAHTLKLTSDATHHWYYCTDNGCAYTTEKELHTAPSADMHYDELNHYFCCTVCGDNRTNSAPHSFAQAGADGWYDGAETKCDGCEMCLYEIAANVDDPTICTITKYNGGYEKVRIPATIDGMTVVAIGDGAFKDNKHITAIEFPNAITIGREAFMGCTALVDINLNNVLQLGWYAFRGCTALTSVVIPASACSAGATILGAFMDCTALVSVSFEDGFADYYAGASSNSVFAGCTSLEEVYLPDSITYLGKSFFEGCTSLVNITLPANLKGLGEKCFYNCGKLAKVEIPGTVQRIDLDAFSYTSAEIIWLDSESTERLDIGGFRYYLGENITLPMRTTTLFAGAFEQSNISSIVIPDKVTLCHSAFAHCKNLETVVIGSGVEYISDNNAFYGCEYLRTVVFKYYEFRWIGKRAFAGCESIEAIFFGATVGYVNNSMGYDTNNERMLMKENGVKHAYAYSPVCPKAGTDFGILAGAWHYNEQGVPTVWTEEEINSNTGTELGIGIDFRTVGTTWTKYRDNIMNSGTGAIDANGNLTVSVEWDMTDFAFGGNPNVKFYVYNSNLSLTEYGENYSSKVIVNTNNTGWARSTNMQMYLDDDNPEGRVFTFTFTFDASGKLTQIDIAETTPQG